MSTGRKIGRIHRGWITWMAAITGAVALLGCGADERKHVATTHSALTQTSGPSGAIFTTMPDGSIVNANTQYQDKREVYLDGGPGPNAPASAAGLDPGMYVFQVTDPSGKYLLSEDPSKCRVVEVADGVIQREVLATELGFPTDTYSVGGRTHPCRVVDGDPSAGLAGPSGRHDWNYDADHGPAAKVFQLMPFANTPNPGGVYKAWMQKLPVYLSKGGKLDDPLKPLTGPAKKECSGCFQPDVGFAAPHTATKTDNFKVRGKIDPPTITVKKFHDRNYDCAWGADEEAISGWPIAVRPPIWTTTWASEDWYFTEFTIYAAITGNWWLREATPAGAVQTHSSLDGTTLSCSPNADPIVIVPVFGSPGEEHTVVYGNVGLGWIEVCKAYDPDGKRYTTPNAPWLSGWKMVLTQPDDPYFERVEKQTEGDPACATFADLLPGKYRVTEIMPAGPWYPSGDAYKDFTIASYLKDGTLEGSTGYYAFTNYCTGNAYFSTKGYWHNRNGLLELGGNPGVIAYANLLLPYSSPSPYFEGGDEPFDGQLQDGTPVSAPFADMAGGTAVAEVSAFLTESNASSDLNGHREQLAQQLLAVIFNVHLRLGGPDVELVIGGAPATGGDLIADAVEAWFEGEAVTEWIDLLTALNENRNGPIEYVQPQPCAISYPAIVE